MHSFMVKVGELVMVPEHNDAGLIIGICDNYPEVCPMPVSVLLSCGDIINSSPDELIPGRED